MRQYSGSNEALNDAKSTKTKVPPKYREKTGEESGWPANLRERKENYLADNQQAVQYRPEYPSWLVGHGRSINVVTINQNRVGCRVVVIIFPCRKAVDSLDVMHQGENTACKKQHKGYYAQASQCVESNECINSETGGNHDKIKYCWEMQGKIG